jgi:hypothetical protein
VVLDLRSDSLSFFLGTRVARVPNGYLAWDILLDDRSLLAYFDGTGAFQTMVARRGRGPGELEEILGVAIGPRDTINVLESFRRHVFGPDRQYVRTEPLPGGFGDLLMLSANKTVLAAIVQTPDQFGYPLHFIDGRGNIMQSFGVADLTIDPRAVQAAGDNVKSMLRRRLERGVQAGTFWIYNPGRFLLQEWDTTGRMMANVLHANDGWYAEASRRNPGQGESKGLGLSHAIPSSNPSVLWLVYHDRRTAGTTPLAAMSGGDVAAELDVVIEAMDTRTFAVLANLRLPKNRAMPVQNGPDQLALIRALNSNEHTYRLVTMRLVR